MRVTVRPGLLDRLKGASGITSDEAFARTLGTSRATLAKVKGGATPSIAFVAAVVEAFGIGFGEVVQLVDDETVEVA